jgi:hypothetical protein
MAGTVGRESAAAGIEQSFLTNQACQAAELAGSASTTSATTTASDGIAACTHNDMRTRIGASRFHLFRIDLGAADVDDAAVRLKYRPSSTTV